MNSTTEKCIQKYYLETDLSDGDKMCEVFMCHYCNGRGYLQTKNGRIYLIKEKKNGK